MQFSSTGSDCQQYASSSFKFLYSQHFSSSLHNKISQFHYQDYQKEEADQVQSIHLFNRSNWRSFTGEGQNKELQKISKR